MNKRDFLILKKKFQKFDIYIFIEVLLLVTISLSTVYTATSYRTLSFFKKEIVWIVLGILIFIIVSFIDYRKYSKHYRCIYVLNILMLLGVFILGDHAKGAKRWIDLGFVSVQPSEFSKVLLVLTFSKFLINNFNKNFSGLKSVFFSFIHIVPLFILVLKQPDLGTALIILFIYCVLIFLYGIDNKTIIKLFVMAGITTPIAYKFLLRDYQKKRIIAFLNPESDIAGSGWNVVQSKIAIGSGELFGKGFMNSTQSKLKFLPESHTDFIGAVFLEEWGFLGGFVIIFLYFSLLFSIIKIADSVDDEYGKLVCYGVASILFFHVFINLGMIMGIMPVTGLPLIFMSYGGSSFILGFLMLGIVNSIKIHKN